MSSREEIERVLGDREFKVAETPAATSGVAWLRSAASRFVNGNLHTHRRRLVEAELAHLEAASLRVAARHRTDLVLDEMGPEVEVMAAIARHVPLAALATGMGVSHDRLEETVDAAIMIGPAYLSGEADERADAAVQRLRVVLDRGADQETAAAIAVLAQTCEATAALIGTTIVLALERALSRGDVDGLVEEALRNRTPLRVMRRVSPDGDYISLDLDAASRELPAGTRPLAFGSGIRPCPGAAHATALTAGTLDALLPRTTGEYQVAWAAHPILRLATHLNVALQ